MPPLLAFALVILVLIAGLAAPTAQERLMRQRRRDAERAARAMRRMSAIRQETIGRMDRIEGRHRP